MVASNWKTMTPVFLIGVGVGAAIGVLFAAKSGEETIEQISGAVDDVSGAVRDGVDGIVTQGRKMAVARSGHSSMPKKPFVTQQRLANRCSAK